MAWLWRGGGARRLAGSPSRTANAHASSQLGVSAPRSALSHPRLSLLDLLFIQRLSQFEFCTILEVTVITLEL